MEAEFCELLTQPVFVARAEEVGWPVAVPSCDAFTLCCEACWTFSIVLRVDGDKLMHIRIDYLMVVPAEATFVNLGT